MTAVIRSATPRDVDRIAMVHVRSWQGSYRGLVPDEVLDRLSAARRRDAWAAFFTNPPLPGMRAWVAEADDRVVGFASAGPSRGEEEGVAEFYTLYLLPEYQGRGIGRALITTVEDSLREAGFGTAVLWVLEGNHPTRRFYERGGWRADGARRSERIGEVDLPVVRYRRSLEESAKETASHIRSE